MRYRTYGNTDLSVSEICYGTRCGSAMISSCRACSPPRKRRSAAWACATRCATRSTPRRRGAPAAVRSAKQGARRGRRRSRPRLHRRGRLLRLRALGERFRPADPGRRFDAVLVDIDHSPESWLDAGNYAFYRSEGLRSLQRHLLPGGVFGHGVFGHGVFGLWSNDPPDAGFRATMAAAFPAEWAEPVVFHNPLQNREVTQTVYFGVSAGE
ncbi:MAG: hypothetical protein ACOC2N_07580 [Spirochaetota bacterium]